MKVCELIGGLLDYWVARSEGMDHATASFVVPAHAYSTDWEFGGPIIERDQIFLDPPHDTHVHRQGWIREPLWTATVSARTRTWSTDPDDAANMVGGRVGRGAGETPLVAAMRAKVASHYGDDVPEIES